MTSVKGFIRRGEYSDWLSYETGDLVVWRGVSYLCVRPCKAIKPNYEHWWMKLGVIDDERPRSRRRR